ncbi:hypothetical protein GCM10010399_39850 [Dactylosporangium fulvum]|uniref:Intracellular proteinase inhibitor BsuPI domain-containing protein n=1 Tax=Dactylosporangium fulvum TaxID=53359 RepID=A0ABY5VYU9_9ACTN|nr:hypothetical protein [Dactylosporangium fulvum]UWP82988.1 hypothetical protein Dfulv_01365 [Dactylosporangium fulvum]
MKLTVGPLPAGVYWRRRAIVGGVLLVAVLVLWAASCGNNTGDKNKTSQGASTSPTSAEPTTTLLVPTTGDPASSAPSSAAPSSSAPQPSIDSTVPVCADADLSLIASPEQPAQFRGAYLKFTLRIKNISARDCIRDLGADRQEMYLQVGAVKMWSSDDCDAPHGSKMTTLKPNIEQSFSIDWNGKASNNGCTNREIPPAGKYQLVGRLDTKISEPITVQLT